MLLDEARGHPPIPWSIFIVMVLELMAVLEIRKPAIGYRKPMVTPVSALALEKCVADEPVLEPILSQTGLEEV